MSQSPLESQIGGSHYKDLKIQPVEFITANKLTFLEGNVVKRVCRHRRKNGREDLEKAIHEIRLLIELEYQNHPDEKLIPKGDGCRVDIRQRIQDSLNWLKKQDSEPEWHNPENVTQEQLGEGYRFLVPWEVDGRYRILAELWLGGGKCDTGANGDCNGYTYRVPSSTPIPPKP